MREGIELLDASKVHDSIDALYHMMIWIQAQPFYREDSVPAVVQKIQDKILEMAKDYDSKLKVSSDG